MTRHATTGLSDLTVERHAGQPRTLAEGEGNVPGSGLSSWPISAAPQAGKLQIQKPKQEMDFDSERKKGKPETIRLQIGSREGYRSRMLNLERGRMPVPAEGAERRQGREGAPGHLPTCVEEWVGPRGAGRACAEAGRHPRHLELLDWAHCGWEVCWGALRMRRGPHRAAHWTGAFHFSVDS